MIAPASRRGFLRGLTKLPLIGGGVTLIGNPSAVAMPITPGMLATYSAWLHFERLALMNSVCGWRQSTAVPMMNPAEQFFLRERVSWSQVGIQAQQRAAVVLSAAGCPLTSPEAEAKWASSFVPAGGIPCG